MMTDASSMSRVGSFAIFGLDLVDLGLIFSEMCLGFCWCHVELIATPIAAIMAARAFVEKFAYCTFALVAKYLAASASKSTEASAVDPQCEAMSLRFHGASSSGSWRQLRRHYMGFPYI